MKTYQFDEQLLKELAGGNERSYNKIYKSTHPKVIQYIQSRFGFDFESAEDLFHDAFIVFHSKVKSGALGLPLRSTLSTFIIGIARNLSLKKQERMKETTSEMPEIAIFPEVDKSHESDYNQLVVNNLISKMNDDQQKLISLFFYKDYSPRAVADELGLSSEGTVRKRKFDTLKKLRNYAQRNEMRA